MTAAIAGVAAAGSLGLAVVVAQDGTAAASTAADTTTGPTATTAPSTPDTWQPSTGGVAAGSAEPQATSGGS